ncbi:MAG: TonB-dependent receptor [Bacteroidales bacterium]
MKLRVAFFSLFLCVVLKISAQVADSTRLLGAVEIKADRISAFATGIKIEKIDTTTLSIRQGASLAMLLNEQTPIILKSNGPSGTSTMSMRGTNSSQSGVFWNGINLQQPNMAMTDLSRISTFEFSDIVIQSGGASALLGSGVIGGSLQLSNKMHYLTPVRVSALMSAGSFGNANGGLKLSAGSKHLAYAGSLSGTWNNNNFKYTDFYGNRVTIDNSLVKSASSVHDLEYLINQHQKLKAAVWYQVTDRQIPPTMTMTSSDQQQWDQAIRSMLQWSYTGMHQSFIVRSAFVDEKEHYQSETANIDAFYHINTLQADFEYKRYLGKRFTLGSGTTAHIIKGEVANYNGIQYQPEGSVWAAFSFSALNQGITAVLNLRQDFSKGYQVPFCPSFSTHFPVSKNVAINFSTSRNFRVPTMNDKYWIPGGNPDLKPESSWNIETGAEFKLHTGGVFSSKINVDLYSLMIENMIQWVPGNAGLWSPQNEQKVWSRGMEISSRSDWKYAGFNGYFRFGYNYTPSTYMEAASGQADIVDKQVIYIPLHKIQETFYFARNACYSLFSFSMTGKRYVQSDNSSSLPAYSLFDVYAGTILKSRKTSFRLQAEIHNVLNTEYQSIQYYPEQGRSFIISLLITK